MKVFLHEITDQDTDLHFTEAESWVADAVRRVDERYPETERSLRSPVPATRPAVLDVTLRKVDDVIVVNGQVQSSVELLCSRCATSYFLECRPKFSALFCKDPVMAGVAHLEKRGDDRSAPGKPAGQNKGHARHAHDTSLDHPEQDIDITYISEDFIDLADVLTEQLQLQIPFQPLCRAECKGICAQCGTDLNRGRCACAKLQTRSPFSVLRDFKVKA